MLGHGSRFDHKIEQAIAALLTHRNVEEAARTIGVSPNTLQRWLKSPEFVAAYKEARQAAFRESIARLQNASGAAAMTILKLMVDPDVSERTRLRAAEIVLSQAAKAIEVENIDDRVTKLELAAIHARRAPKRSALPRLSTDASLEPPKPPAAISAVPQSAAACQTEKDDDANQLTPTTASGDHTSSALEPSGDEPETPADRLTDDEKGE